MPGRYWLADVLPAILPAADAGPEMTVGDHLSYVVVDEIEESVVVLVLEPWPRLDDRGRLRFADEELRLSVEIELDQLQQQLDHNRFYLSTPDNDTRAQQRPVRAGDVFALAITTDASSEISAIEQGHLPTPILDVSAEARRASKSQYFAAVGPVLGEQEVSNIAAEYFSEDAS